MSEAILEPGWLDRQLRATKREAALRRAAPDLLAACKAALGHIEDPWGDPEIVRALKGDLARAIAKAEGNP